MPAIVAQDPLISSIPESCDGLKMVSKTTIISIENRVLVTARLVREHYFPGSEKYSADWILIPAIRDLMKLHPGASPQELCDQLVAPSSIQPNGLMSRYVIASLTAELKVPDDPTRCDLDVNVFNGGRKFSFARLSAMASFFASRERICKTKLNQLLFYSDFVNYVSFGRSISGARYVRHRGGPLLEKFDSILKTLVYTGVLKVNERPGGHDELTVAHEHSIEELSLLEIVTLLWVHANFNWMSVSELNEHSQQESAHSFTPQDEYIAYEYSRLLKKLPEKEVIDIAH